MTKRFLAGAATAALMALPVQAQDDGVTIGVAIPAATHGWTGGVNFHTQEAIDRLSEQYDQIEFVLATSADSNEQISDLEDMVATRDLDALVVLPFESDPLTGPVQSIAEQDIWVTVVDRALGQEGIEDLYVAGDNEAFGRVAGEFFTEQMPDGGNIVVIRGLPIVIDNQRIEGFEAAIEGSGIEVLGMEHGNFNRDDAFTVMQDFLSRHPEIDAVWATDDDQAVGAIAAIEQAGREGEMWVVGGAGMKQMVQRVMEGDEMVPADITYPPTMIATALDMTVSNFVSQGPVTGEFIIESVLITPENAEQFYYPDSPF